MMTLLTSGMNAKYCAPVLRTASYPRQFGEGEHIVFAGDMVPEILALFLQQSTQAKESVMTSVSTPTVVIDTLADLLEQLGGMHPNRVRFRPAPGTATEEDVRAIHERERRLYELVDGVLVEKAMGLRESFLAITLATILLNFVRPRNWA